MLGESPVQFDLVLTDQTMPEMTVLELAEKVMAIPSDLSVVLATGYSRQVDESIAYAKGVAGYVMKPVRKQILADLLRNVLHSK